jgi:hypothetical protein
MRPSSQLFSYNPRANSALSIKKIHHFDDGSTFDVLLGLILT